MRAKIVIPRLDAYESIVLRDKESFLEFIAFDASHIECEEVNGVLTEIRFKWNPYGDDYPPTVVVCPGQVFMHNEDDKDDYKVVREIEDWWYIYEK